MTGHEQPQVDNLWLRDVLRHRDGEVRLYVKGRLVSGTWASQVADSLRALLDADPPSSRDDDPANDDPRRFYLAVGRCCERHGTRHPSPPCGSCRGWALSVPLPPPSRDAAKAEAPPLRCWLCQHPVRQATCEACGCMAHYPTHARERRVKCEAWDEALRWVRQQAGVTGPEYVLDRIDRAEPFNPYRDVALHAPATEPAQPEGGERRG